MRGLSALVALAVVAGVAPARAASVDFASTDSDGHPASFAVAELFPLEGAPLAPSHLPSQAIVDQRDETFIPLVTLIQRGGQVVFTNSDHTMHQVYSFSKIRQFAFEIDKGQKSAPVLFDEPGVAAIGCNIHDQMVTFVYVADTPWAVLMDAQGRARLQGVPAGDYRVSVWDPRLMPGYHPEAASLQVSDNGARFKLSIPLVAGQMPGMKHPHSENY